MFAAVAMVRLVPLRNAVERSRRFLSPVLLQPVVFPMLGILPPGVRVVLIVVVELKPVHWFVRWLERVR